MQTEAEKGGFLGEYTSLYESMVDGMRRRGWSRIDAEGEALDRIERLRQKRAQARGDHLTKGD